MEQFIEKLVVDRKLFNNLNLRIASEDENNKFISIESGDEIVSITNLGVEGETQAELSAQQAIQILGKFSQGANADAFKSRAVKNLFNRNGAYGKTPVGHFKIKLKKRSSGNIVEYSFPWETDIIQDEHCSMLHSSPKENHEEVSSDPTDDSQDESNIVSSVISYKQKNFAYIKIIGFDPSEETNPNDYLPIREKIHAEVKELREFLSLNKNTIHGVLIDVRDNGGGYGSYPQLIANAFTNDFVENIKAVTLVSPTNHSTFYNLELSRYYKRLKTTDPLLHPILDTYNLMGKYLNDKKYQTKIDQRELFLPAADRFDGDENDALPESYSKNETEILKPILADKPIAILTNSNCYSACDVFVSFFKDYRIGKIFGETLHTGGGGANVIDWNEFVKPVVTDAFGNKMSIVPNGKKLSKGMEIHFAWNTIFRHKAADERERYIEGVGVLADYVYRKTLQDILVYDSSIVPKIFEDMLDEQNSKGFYLNR